MKKNILILSLIIAIVACSKNEDPIATPINNFDRTALLTNWAENIIIPSFVNYQNKVNMLSIDVATFNTNPTEANLQIVRNSWLEGYKAYQYVSQYYFGKAEEISFKEATNTYPTNAIGIETNINSGTYNLELLSQFDKQGFPGLDYLLNGLANTDAMIVGFYSSNADAIKYKKYLTDVSNRLKTNSDIIVNDWNSVYKSSYISNTGTSVSGSVNRTTNNFVKNLEKDIRTGKLGIPAGIFSNGILYANKVEGFYKNDVSKILLNEAIKASQDFFNGKHFNTSTTGSSLKSYLDFLNIIRNNQKFSDIINNQFDLILAKNNTLNESFSQQIISNNAKMIEAYDALQQNVVYTKLDMMQALNISIDYVDGDGD